MGIIVALGWRAAAARRRLRRRWRGFWARVEAQGDPVPVFRELDRRYREPGRHYHTWEHVRECLEALEQAVVPAGDPVAVEMAIWFHDAVYDPRAGDNEERSTRLALEAAAGMGLDEERTRQVGALVLATRVEPGAAAEAETAGPPAAAAGPLAAAPGALAGSAGSSGGEGDAWLVKDVDLSILGRPRRRYRRYERDIRREYAWVPAEEFRLRRGALLQGLLGRPRLYSTEPFRSRWEDRARRNLRWSLRRLGLPAA